MSLFGAGGRWGPPAPSPLGKVGSLRERLAHLARLPVRVWLAGLFSLVVTLQAGPVLVAASADGAGWVVVVDGAVPIPAPGLEADRDGSTLVIPLPATCPRFGILFRHSVEQTPVIEWFEPAGDGDGLLLVATEYRSYGGRSSHRGAARRPFRRLPDRFRIEGLAVPVGELNLRILPLTEHALLVGGEAYDLTQWAGPDGRLRVRVLAAGLVRKDDEEEGRS